MRDISKSLEFYFFELSHIESNDYDLAPQRFNLKNHLVDVLLGFHHAFEEKNMAPEIKLPDGEVFVEADRSAVTRVLENLLSNATRYGENYVEAGLLQQDTLRLYVENDEHQLDQGTDPERFFGRFFIADRSRTKKSAGLGLSIAKSLMERMGGTIHARLDDGMLTIICEWRNRI